jgi:hypothetical protein
VDNAIFAAGVKVRPVSMEGSQVRVSFGVATALVPAASFVTMCATRLVDVSLMEEPPAAELEALCRLLDMTDKTRLVQELQKALHQRPDAIQHAVGALFRTRFMTVANEEKELGQESLRVIANTANTTGITKGIISGSKDMPKAGTTKHATLLIAAAKYLAFVLIPVDIDAVGLFGCTIDSAAAMRLAKGEHAVFVFKSFSGGTKNKAGGNADDEPPMKRSFSGGRKSLSSNQGALRSLLVASGLAWLVSTDPETHQKTDYGGVWPTSITREAAKRCAIANSEVDAHGHVSEEVVKRYMKSVGNWKGNGLWKNDYKPHFVEMRKRGITYEQALKYLQDGNCTWYLQQA